jgi:Fe-S-cluster-containing dehydrogenase component
MGDKALAPIVVDLDRCWGCRTCEVACSLEHRLAPDLSFIHVEEKRESSPIPGSPQGKSFIPYSASTATIRPVCQPAPPGPGKRRGRNRAGQSRGMHRLRGLRRLLSLRGAHPPSRIGYSGLCDLCVSRQVSGRLPACVQHCPGRALSLADSGDETASAAQKTEQKLKFGWAVGRTVYKAR